MRPRELTKAAGYVLTRPNAAPSNSLVAAALLARQALEIRVREEWNAKEKPLSQTNMANQFHALRQLRNPSIAGMAYQTWASLSGICHHHLYGRMPTFPEVRRLIASVDRLITSDWH